MAGSLYLLRDFFKAGRNHHGGYMGEHEDMLNATQRNLSLFTDTELLALRDSALLFIREIELTYQQRDGRPAPAPQPRRHQLDSAAAEELSRLLDDIHGADRATQGNGTYRESPKEDKSTY
mgnify:CR=1 FL=1